MTNKDPRFFGREVQLDDDVLIGEFNQKLTGVHTQKTKNIGDYVGNFILIFVSHSLRGRIITDN